MTLPVAPGALSAWHGGSLDFSPGDGEVIAGLWRVHPAQPLSGLFCCFIFANVAMPSVLPPRTDAATAPAPPLPTTAAPAEHRRRRSRGLGPRSWQRRGRRGKTHDPSRFLQNRRRFRTSRVSPFFVTYFPALTLRPAPTGKASVALNRSVRGKT